VRHIEIGTKGARGSADYLQNRKIFYLRVETLLLPKEQFSNFLQPYISRFFAVSAHN
jgi:hypothetical protein